MIVNTLSSNCDGGYMPLTGGTMTGIATLYAGSTLSASPTSTDNSSKITTTAWIHNHLFIAMASKDDITVPAYGSGGTTTGTMSIARTDCTPIGICGYYLVNASSSGTRSQYCTVLEFMFSGTTCSYKISNSTTVGAAKVQLRVYPLYRRA